jgi:class 3 adenylate cyclase
MSGTVRMLFVAGDRGGGKQVALQLPDEHTEIIDAVAVASCRGGFALVQPIFAAKRRDVTNRLVRERPQVVHFAGHGEDRRLQLVDDGGFADPLSADNAALLFANLRDRVTLLVLNACQSLAVARRLVEDGHVDFAIGTDGPLHDDIARRFARSFYGRIGDGLSLRSAFELAQFDAGTEAMKKTELLAAPGLDASSTVLVPVAPGHEAAEATSSTDRPEGSEPVGEPGPPRGPSEKSVALVDLVGYSDLCAILERHLGVPAVAELNARIQLLILDALRAAGVSPDGLPYKHTGDGAIVVLDRATQASGFANSLHRLARERNPDWHFRIGIATGQIFLDRFLSPYHRREELEMAGMAIAQARRLEEAAQPGQVLIDTNTWAQLPEPERRQYGHEEEVGGKRAERFRAHRRPPPDPEATARGRAPAPKVGGEAFSPRAKVEFTEWLGEHDAPSLADLIGIRRSVRNKWRKGYDASEIWDYLYERSQLGELPGFLREIDRDDLADTLEGLRIPAGPEPPGRP